MNRIFTALDVIFEPPKEIITEEIIEAANTTSGLGSIVIPAIALVAIAAFGIIYFAKNKRTEK